MLVVGSREARLGPYFRKTDEDVEKDRDKRIIANASGKVH